MVAHTQPNQKIKPTKSLEVHNGTKQCNLVITPCVMEKEEEQQQG
jgi:hypothetical protein